VGINPEREFTPGVTGFARLGWDDGRYESFAYTEVDQTAAAGFTWAGNAWRRPLDKWGAAAVENGISGDHRRYLALGGQGFLLGDGGLSYGHERILEAFYTVHIGWGMSMALTGSTSSTPATTAPAARSRWFPRAGRWIFKAARWFRSPESIVTKQIR
jgi:hypothetical protein